jgi:predicted MFS family arabinose efflux permease
MARPTLLSRAFVLGFAANFFHSFAFHGYVHLGGRLEELGANGLEIGVVLATMAAAAILARPWVGRMMDTRGRRAVVLLGSATHVIATLGYLAVDRLGPLLCLIRIVHGIADAMLFSVLFTIAADIVPRARRTEGIALFGISGMIPLSLAGWLGDIVLARGDYSDWFMLTAAAAFIGAIAGLWLPDSRPPLDESSAPPRSFLLAATDPPLRPVWLLGFCFTLALASYFGFLKPFVDSPAGVGTMGGFFSAYTIAAIGLRLFLGWLPDRIGPRPTLLPAIGCTAAGVLALAFATSDSTVIVAGVLCGVGHGFAFPILSALVVARARPSERGMALAAFTALFDVGLVVGGPLLGLVIDLSDYTTMFVTAALVALAGLVAFVLWDSPTAAD